MITHAGFIGAKINYKAQAIDVHFGNEYDLSKMIDSYKSTLQEKNFRMVNSKQARDAEKGRTIRITDIPLNVTSTDIKSFFDKEGEVTRFSMVTSGAWQHAYIVYADFRSIAAFYDHMWSIQILDFWICIYPTDLSDEQFELRNQYSCKLTGLPPNTTANDLTQIINENRIKSCFIPRSHTSYRPLNYAFVSFATPRDVEKAGNQLIKLNGRTLFWTPL